MPSLRHGLVLLQRSVRYAERMQADELLHVVQECMPSSL
ncbi:Thaumatin family [Musa troglodytarum]|uniref:Thaumatin family n=1 Tax=Musa troglodytarum TaxID=320322 RepID=A0A9E7G238_9LILI|nr:Thaumatin family [Musa troglodytarum]